MHSGFSSIDWYVFGTYFLVLALTSVIFSRIQIKSTRDYFTANKILYQRLRNWKYRFAEIPHYLGRDYSVYGQVEQGEQRGKNLGFPTANILPGVTLALPEGVYVSKIKLAGKTHYGVTNVGKRPTFGENSVTVETFIFDFEKVIYGEYLEVIPLSQLRPEMKFSSVEELKTQIRQDIETARNYLDTNEPQPVI